MSLEHVRDLLHVAREYHQNVRTVLESLEAQTDDPTLQDLLDRLIRHEKYLSASIRNIEEREPEEVLGADFRYTSKVEDFKHLLEATRDPVLNRGDLLRFCLELDKEVIGFYREMESLPCEWAIHDLLQNMLEMEELERYRLQGWLAALDG